MIKKEIEKLNEGIIKEFGDNDIVLGDGSINSKVMLIGEAPGSKEVELKKPFVGQAGKHLEEFLNILNLDRKDLYITNVVKFRPTRASKKTGKKVNRAPSPKEVESFREYLYKEIEIISPEIVVTLGNVPLETILEDKKATIGDSHGKMLSRRIANDEFKIFPLYHPAAIIYRRELKSVYLKDLEKLKEIIQKSNFIH